MRQFATDRWSEADHAALRSALTQHFAKAAEASREGMLDRMISRGSTGLTDEHDNLRLAFNWARAPSTRPPWRVRSWLAAIQMRSMAEEIPRGLDFITAMVSTNGGDRSGFVPRGSGMSGAIDRTTPLQDVCTVIARDRGAAERSARMTAEVRAAASEARLWVMAAPREVGGLELTLMELITTFEQLGRADPAFSWIAMNSIVTGLTAAKLSEAARAPVFATLDGPYGFAGALNYSSAARVEGGWSIQGDWRFMTGSSDAGWCTVYTQDPTADGRVYAMVLPMDELDITDTWLGASSMRGTGSNAVSGKGIFVPDERVAAMSRRPIIDRPLFRVAPLVVLWAPCAALVIGAMTNDFVQTWFNRNILLGSRQWPQATYLEIMGVVDGQLSLDRGADRSARAAQRPVRAQ